MRMMASLLIVGLGLGRPWVAHAEEPAKAPQSEAAARFERGVELYADGALDAALAEFERAYEITLDSRVLYNIGRVQMERHRYVEAINAFERYLGGADIAENRRAQVQADMEKLRARVGQVWVESDVEGAELFVNGTAAGTLPLTSPVPVNPGNCEIRLEKSGYRSAHQSLTIAGGDTPRISLSMVPVAPALVSPRADASQSEPKTRYNYVPFWISAASAVALGGGAAVLGVLALDKHDKLEEGLANPPSDAAAVETLRNDGKTLAGVADGLAVGAIVAGGLGIYFLIDPPKKKADPSTGVSDLRVTAGPNQAFLSGRFW